MPGYLHTIAKEDIATLPNITFGGEIMVVDSHGKSQEACEYLARQELVGFDTESRPSFRKGVVNKVALLQLSTGDKCFLFRLPYIRLDKHVIRILENKRVTKVGLSVDGDIRELATLAAFRPAGFEDLQKIVPAYGIGELSLVKIAAIVLGRRISKAQRLSNWESVRLTDAQKMYAATDAWVCAEIYNKLRSL